jgi:hypothetical protein
MSVFGSMFEIELLISNTFDLTVSLRSTLDSGIICLLGIAFKSLNSLLVFDG